MHLIWNENMISCISVVKTFGLGAAGIATMKVYDNFDFPIKDESTLVFAMEKLAMSGCFYLKV